MSNFVYKSEYSNSLSVSLENSVFVNDPQKAFHLFVYFWQSSYQIVRYLYHCENKLKTKSGSHSLSLLTLPNLIKTPVAVFVTNYLCHHDYAMDICMVL